LNKKIIYSVGFQKYSSYIYFLLFCKIFGAVCIFYIMQMLFPGQMFGAPDIDAYLGKYPGSINCGQTKTNALYSLMLCSMDVQSSLDLSKLQFLFLAASINLISSMIFFYIFHKHLTHIGKIFYILLLSFHPYLGLYFFQFYTDIFGVFGVALNLYYLADNKDIDWKIMLCNITLVNLRAALIPFIILISLILIIKNLKFDKVIFYSTLQIIVCFIVIVFSNEVNYLGEREIFAQQMLARSNNFSDYMWNLFSLLSLRESYAINGFDSIPFNSWLMLSLISAFMISNIIGLVGWVQFSISNSIKYLLPLSMIIVPIISIGHLRYLLPILPVILFGLSFFIFNYKNERIY